MAALPTPEERQRAADRLAAAEAFLNGVRQLRKNEAWQKFEALLALDLVDQRKEHENPKKHPMRRAEHLWAVKCLEKLNSWLDAEEKRAEKAAKKADEALEP